jgi:transcriptional regulator with XRE-family HTH domain
MIDDRVCLFYVADRVQDIVDGETTAEEFLREIIYTIGGNARWKRNNPDELIADLPPIDGKKRGRKDWLSKRDREDLEEWKQKNPKFNEHNTPKTILHRLIWMHLRHVRQKENFNQAQLAQAVNLHQGTISHVENGRMAPSPEVQLQIAHALGYELEELIEILKNLIDWNEQEEVIATYIKQIRANGASNRPSLRNKTKARKRYR